MEKRGRGRPKGSKNKVDDQEAGKNPSEAKLRGKMVGGQRIF